MGFKSLFIKEDGDQKPPEKTTGAKTAPVNNEPLPPTFSGIKGMVNEKMLSNLKDVIRKGNLSGVDYYEFSQAVEQLGNIIPDDKTRFAAAFATLISSGGVSKATLLSSIDTYIGMINKEKEVFSVDFKKRADETVGKRTKAVQDAQKRIAELQKELTNLSQFVIEESQNVQQEELKLKQVQSNFDTSVEHLLNCLNSDKEKINLYINEIK
ncbi:MAG: hypothetical protein WC333_02405 [Dehalococcoidia bacterium]|jgi:hypothetical protein